MNVLDENIPRLQWYTLKSRRIAMRQIGYEAGRSGMQDEEIIPLLLSLRRPTFFTLDKDFYRPRLCHARYSLVWLDILQLEIATFIPRFLRHPEFDTEAKRMGMVIHVSHTGSWFWRLHGQKETHIDW
ncbi:MAG: hypothetical protein IAE85_02990 [Anaerolinea sp.]|nr:hypothetical protein [Anaerolinea sp.]